MEVMYIREGTTNNTWRSAWVTLATDEYADYYSAGDSVSISNQGCSGCLTSSNKEIQLTVILPKKIPSGITVSVSSLKANIRFGTGGYPVAQSSAFVSGGYEYKNNISTIYATADSNALTICLSFSASQNNTNNQALIAQVASMNFTFKASASTNAIKSELMSELEPMESLSSGDEMGEISSKKQENV